MDIDYPVTCLLLSGKKIDMNTCFDIHMVVEDGAPKHTAPEESYKLEDYVEICLHCKYHRND